MWALFWREVKRFQKIMLDTVFSPIVSMVLYLAVFGVVAGSRQIEGINFLTFIYAGLLSMIVINASFSNPGFALVIGKNLGNIIDLQVAPIKSWAVGLAYAFAAMARGFITFFIALIVTVCFIPGFTFSHPIEFFVVLFLSGLQFGLLGVTFGMWASTFESLTFVTTFILQPMIFLAGVFYPVSNLPAPWNIISYFNPLHHNINLIRYTLLGYSDMNPWISFVIVIGLNLVLFFSMWYSSKKNLIQ